MATYRFARRIVTEMWDANGVYSTHTRVVIGTTIDSVIKGTTVVETRTVMPKMIPVATVLKTLCMRVGFEESKIDVSQVTGDLIGLTITDDDYKTVIEMLMRGYFLNVAIDNDSIKFTSRIQSVYKRIPYTDLDVIEPTDGSSAQSSTPIQITRIPDAQLPKILQVNYLDPAQDFQKCTQYVVRIWGKSDVVHDINFNMIMAPDTAAQIAEKALYEMWSQRQHYKFVTSMQHADIRVNQVIEVEGKPYRYWEPLTDYVEGTYCRPSDGQGSYVFKCIQTGNSGTFEPAWNSDASHVQDGSAMWVADELPIHKIMITKKDTGVNGAIEWEGISYDEAVYDSTRAGTSGIPVAPIYTAPGTSLPLFKDIPIVSETHDSPGFYAMATGASASWNTGVVYKSADKGATWNAAFTITSPTIMGLTKQRLGSGPYTIWDNVNTVDVELVKGTLVSATDSLVLRGANLCLIGGEIVQFANAELIAPNTYRLSRLLRGRRGTEQHRTRHKAGEHFALLSNLTRVVRPISEVNVPLLYKVVPPGAYLEDQPSFEFTWTGEGLKPFSPVLPKWSKTVAGDITLTWVRRSRIGQELVLPSDMPLGESYEKYYVDVCNDYMTGRVINTYTVNNSTTFVYTKAMQIADFGDAEVKNLAFRICQVSDLIGRGYPTVVLVPN